MRKMMMVVMMMVVGLIASAEYYRWSTDPNGNIRVLYATYTDRDTVRVGITELDTFGTVQDTVYVDCHTEGELDAYVKFMTIMLLSLPGDWAKFDKGQLPIDTTFVDSMTSYGDENVRWSDVHKIVQEGIQFSYEWCGIEYTR